jgi:protocatechuate 3,4-dioxygenase beta subunit
MVEIELQAMMTLSKWRKLVGVVAFGVAFHFGTVVHAQDANGVSAPVGGAQAGSKATKDKEQTCRIAGMVTKLEDGTPLKNATVSLWNSDDKEHTIAAKTRSDGRYELRNVPPGRYKVKAFRNGYVAMEYGQLKASDPGAMLALSAGENKEPVNFRMIPAAAIAGRIFDEDGEPMWNTFVMLSRESYQDGAKKLQTMDSARSNDRGEYRFYGLAPGRYFVSAQYVEWETVTGEREFTTAEQPGEKGYVKMYYPGTAEMAKASAITVKEGDEASGMDFQLKQVAVYRIRGKVLNMVTHKGGANTVLELVGRTNHLEWDFGGSQQVLKADGSFEFPNVPPGSYEMIALWNDQGKTYSAREDVNIGGSDLEGVTLVLGAGATIDGYIRWEGKPSLEGPELQVYLRPPDVAYVGRENARVEANQQFTLKDVGNGDYRVSVLGLGKDCYIKDTVYGETHSAEGLITVAKGGVGEHLEVTVSSRGARVQGAVLDKDGLPAAGVWVVAVPEEAKRSDFRLFKSQTTDQYGKYDLHGLAPGSYQVFSWTGIENGEWQDEEFLKQYERKGESVEVRDDGVKAVQLKVIERKSERE